MNNVWLVIIWQMQNGEIKTDIGCGTIWNCNYIFINYLEYDYPIFTKYPNGINNE
jgi:hypothetical protein